MKTLKVLMPETGELIGKRRTPRPYTHAYIVSWADTWHVGGFALSRENARKAANKWLDRNKGTVRIVEVSL